MRPIELPTLAPAGPAALSPEDTTRLAAEVRALAEERNAVILAHNYQVPEVQDVAHFVGDSLGLSRRAADTDAVVIAFCGVHFMAETASILSPGKTVLLPDLDAGCSLADSITADRLRAWKAQHPGAIVVMYVNTTAEVKADLEDERYDAPEARGLDVLLRGLSLVRSDDELLELSGALYDGLYEYQRR